MRWMLLVVALFCVQTGFTQRGYLGSIKFDHKITIVHLAAADAIVYALDHNVQSFAVNAITDKKIRKRMALLGDSVHIIFDHPEDIVGDSTVMFKTTNASKYRKRKLLNTIWYYDFSIIPKPKTTRTEFIKNGDLIRMNDRVYYSDEQDEIPMM